MSVADYKELRVWQQAMVLVTQVYEGNPEVKRISPLFENFAGIACRAGNPTNDYGKFTVPGR